jgi:predicted porin
MAKVDMEGWGAALAVDEIRGGPGAFAGLTSASLADRRAVVNGYVDVARLRIAAGVVRRDNQASALSRRSDLWFAGLVYAATPALKLEGEGFRLASKGNGARATLVAVRGIYSLSRQTALYATAGRIVNSGSSALSVSAGAGGSSPLPGTAQSGLAAGIRHSF